MARSLLKAKISTRSLKILLASLSLMHERPSIRKLRFLLSLNRLSLNRFGVLELRKKKAVILSVVKDNVNLLNLNKKTYLQIILPYVLAYIQWLRKLIRRILLVLNNFSKKSFLALIKHWKLFILPSILVYFVLDFVSHINFVTHKVSLKRYANFIDGVMFFQLISLSLFLDFLSENNYLALSAIVMEWMLIVFSIKFGFVACKIIF